MNVELTDDMRNLRYINEIRVRIQETCAQIKLIEKMTHSEIRKLRQRIINLDKSAQKFYKEYGDRYDVK